MQNFTFKRHFLSVVFLLLGCVAIKAADDGLITEQITVNLEKAGTLPNKISDAEKYKITNLKVVGDINGDDIRFIRDMGGQSFERKVTDGKLSKLDLSEAKIVEGGDHYYVTGDNVYYSTVNHVLGYGTFARCGSLKSILLPSDITSIEKAAFLECGVTSLTVPLGVTSIGEYAFYDCDSLESITLLWLRGARCTHLCLLGNRLSEIRLLQCSRR